MADVHGTLTTLTERTMGDAFDTAASSGAQTLSLYDVSDFDEDGGSVLIGGSVYLYDTVDMDADTIHLTTGLLGAAAVDDTVELWDPDNLVVVSERVALVTVDDQEDGDGITADVDYSLSPLLAQSTLTAGQSVSLTRDGTGYRLTAVHGKNNAALNRSTTGYLQYGEDNYDGTVTGLEVDTTASPVVVRLVGQSGGGVKVQQSDRSTYLAIRASAFTVSSDPATKTDRQPAPDALAIIEAAPAATWRYLTDDDNVTRVGPYADDLASVAPWMVGEDPQDGHLDVDLARMVGVLWTAVAQLAARIDELEKGAR